LVAPAPAGNEEDSTQPPLHLYFQARCSSPTRQVHRTMLLCTHISIAMAGTVVSVYWYLRPAERGSRCIVLRIQAHPQRYSSELDMLRRKKKKPRLAWFVALLTTRPRNVTTEISNRVKFQLIGHRKSPEDGAVSLYESCLRLSSGSVLAQ
jgi:hypothetical protein